LWVEVWCETRFWGADMTTHGPVRFREREASRAIRAAEKAGLTVNRVEVSAEGRLSLVTSRGDKQEAALPFDAWKTTHARPA
jgi:hypothetical protein